MGSPKKRVLLPADHRPASATYAARATHGIHATYARGCRCQPCREAWREYRRDKEAERVRWIRFATHPDGCMCRGCKADRAKGLR